MQGWISLYRCLLDKAIWKHSTPEQKTILVTLLLMANHEEKEWEWCGMQFKAKPGQFITSIEKIQEKAGKGVTRQNVRTALKKFKKYEFLTDESTKTGRLITIVNWGTYQSKGKKCNHETNQRVTDTSPTPNQQLTPNNNYNNYNNDNKKHSESVYKILNYWNDKPFITHKDNAEIRSKIEKGLNKYSEADILTAINNYEKVYNSDFYYKHKWALTDFLKQSNGVPNFLEEGKVWENYKEHNSNSIIDGRKPV